MKIAAKILSAFALASVAAACSQQTAVVQQHPLQASGDVSYICRRDSYDREIDPAKRPLGEGRPIDECNPGSIARGERNLYAMVTQTATGEVAVINVPLNPAYLQDGEGFVDIDPGVPGYGFLSVGDTPGQIVTTPGGYATFVGVAEVGKPGIFGIPTSCVAKPNEEQFDRDITSWPACSLPAAPGAIAIAVDPPTAMGVATSCDRSEFEDPDPTVSESVNAECPANLKAEEGPAGRRKLLVALPDRGSIAVIDAQWLLNRKPGSFGECKIETEVKLKVELPVIPIDQRIPDDLLSCDSAAKPPEPPPPPAYQATPSDFELVAGRLYVSDGTAPIVHRLNAEQPCSLVEGPPLLTRSFDNPDRIVTTSKVAVSPLTPSGKRFAYAVDQYDWPLATVMMFDVSPGSTDPTPIIREGSSFLPFDAPDRIQFSGSPKDVTFVLRDRPRVDPLTGNVVVGTACDPDPRNTGTAGAQYRPSSDYVTGARATELRGLFASVLLSNGQISMVDVEDFDAACRRPRQANTDTKEEDFRGCKNDPLGLPGCTNSGSQGETCYQTDLGVTTVTNEVSCHMIEPHRQRSAVMGITSDTFGMHAPSLRSLPQLTPPPSAVQGTFRTRPKVLGVDFADGTPAQVYVGTTLYSPSPAHGQELKMDPDGADRYSVVLPFARPRSYTASNTQLLIYEGPVTEKLRNGFLQTRVTGDPSLAPGTMRLHDPSAGYCDAGVSDPEVMRELGARRFALAGEALEKFAEEQSDYVVMSSDFPASDDVYWSGNNSCSRASCEVVFGRFDERELLPGRDFQIVDAQQQILLLRPRRTKSADPKEEALWVAADQKLIEEAACCFPSGSEYVVRASKQWILRGTTSGFRHQVHVVEQKDAAGNEILNCERDCDPRKRYFDSRIFEVAAKSCDGDDCAVGVAEASYFCLANNAAAGVTLTEEAARCIHETPTERFAVYRGTDTTLRDMRFTWDVTGGFVTQRIDLSLLANYVSPRTLVSLPQFSWLTVIDSAALGLSLVSLDSLSVLTPPLN